VLLLELGLDPAPPFLGEILGIASAISVRVMTAPIGA
jgi:hypothetical protein